ncbi:MAG: N-acetylmuramoyl-L-alanine amidase [Phycisphaeraceae bacterium]|nr:N-acetylmuramoyl-L-alanine amidase [Phycisphaeraceae bacterium]
MPSAKRTSSRPAKRDPRSAAEQAASRRLKLVWVSFIAAMTLVGGGLLALDNRPAPRLDGLSLAPLLASSGLSGVATITRTRATLDQDRWQAIVIHSSGSPIGSPATIGAEHERAGFRGLGHHFIIGNGQGMEDGELHVGFRWLDQLPGAHAGGKNGDYYNQHSISICLVGDGRRHSFTSTQIRRLAEVISTLCRDLDIPKDRVFLYSDVAEGTDPGPLFPATALAEQLSQLR